MAYSVPILARRTEADELQEALADTAAELGASVRRPETHALQLDPGTLSLVIDTATVSVPTLLSSIASAWAAHVTTRRHRRKGSDAPPDAAGSALVVETDSGSLRFAVGASGIATPMSSAALPARPEDISRIYLE